MEIYHRYRENAVPPGSIVVKFYHSGDQIRGFLRKVTPPGEDDTIFPGEEMEPDDAFRAARNKMSGEIMRPIYVELSEGVNWNPAWGQLE
ncbi:MULTISPECIES: hypothetical protein [Rhizobium]|uniref:Uncharacterized protein n=1 Tax=Rhizobium tropici TaxID=398 RepID=A0A6P1CJV1_RHITR|nr:MULTISPECIES: hypothetical protein [Rhizobium]AGB75681.1 hypothetical protein RTCIAT899_PC09475 [Rhizobium tropici CIAT 899]MBB4245350.1 hypothetical protein [Rhizobium tropici]MBB5595795.1 hypothetical protein [Rhizobium tropici]MBB6495679.1 hypothetical protein [Rhizobium tropici]NEV15004.1 hypothetical protein [Rhizobium tropici]